MIQTELKPVTVYRSTDTGAPQLTPTAGSLKTILKACLVEGYGNQPSLGWEMPYEDTTSGVFKSKDPKSPNAALRIKNSATMVADVAMMIEPTGLDTAKKIALHTGKRLQYRGTAKPQPKWMLIGHSRAFVLLIEGYYKTRFLWFGAFPSLAAGDTGNCVMYYSSDGDSDAIYGGSAYYSAPNLLTSNGGAIGIYAKSATGLSLGVPTCAVSSLCGAFWGVPFPDQITNGLSISECYLNEYNGSRHPMRGLWPGMYACANSLDAVEEWGELGDFVGSSDRFINCCLYDSSNQIYHHYLINTTAWRA